MWRLAAPSSYISGMPTATPVEITVFSDYLCPWCWPAAVHLKRLREEFGPAIRVIRRAFLLRPDDAERSFTAYHLQHRVAAESATGLPFHVPRAGAPYPRSSAWALEAAKWVERHHPDRVEDFALAVFQAFFQVSLDISSPALLAKLATQLGLDGAALATALERHDHRAEVFADHDEAMRRGITAVPAVIIGHDSVSGAAPYEEYAKAVRDELASRQPAKRAARV